jgi:hypothetical protein
MIRVEKSTAGALPMGSRSERTRGATSQTHAQGDRPDVLTQAIVVGSLVAVTLVIYLILR